MSCREHSTTLWEGSALGDRLFWQGWRDFWNCHPAFWFPFWSKPEPLREEQMLFQGRELPWMQCRERGGGGGGRPRFCVKGTAEGRGRQREGAERLLDLWHILAASHSLPRQVAKPSRVWRPKPSHGKCLWKLISQVGILLLVPDCHRHSWDKREI